MSRVTLADGQVSFRCPGCGHRHTLPVGVGAGHWGFNGDLERPTLAPSIHARSGCYCDPSCCQGEGAEFCDRNMPAGEDGVKVCYECHFYVRDGRIEFIPDCSHALAGQVIDLPEVESPKSETERK